MSDLAAARRIADTVLYEGYLLYPYRSSSAKNQVRWQYGIVGPAGGVEAGAGEEPSLATECLIEADASARVDVHLRFLQVQTRTIEAAVPSGFSPVGELRAGGSTWLPWDEAVEHEVVVADLSLPELVAGHLVDVAVPGGEDVAVLDDRGAVAGRVFRRRAPLTGRLHLSAVAGAGTHPLWTLRCRLDNTAPFRPEPPVPAGPPAVLAPTPDSFVCRHADSFGDSAHKARPVSPRDIAVRQSFVGTHLLLAVRAGAFVSLIDPPAWAAPAAAACTNRRAWPVLLGRPGDTDLVLASPIILYDHPELAPESPGALYDSTEIDEILTLRIMTLTDEEKAAARATDPRAAEIIARSDLMPDEVFERLHGALRDFAPPATPTPAAPAPTAHDQDGVPWWGEEIDAAVSPEHDTVRIGAVDVANGSRVRLRPSRRADAQDIFLAGRTAVVTRVYSDVDGGTHVAVILEGDELAEIHDWYGRYYYFAPDELEPLQASG